MLLKQTPTVLASPAAVSILDPWLKWTISAKQPIKLNRKTLPRRRRNPRFTSRGPVRLLCKVTAKSPSELFAEYSPAEDDLELNKDGTCIACEKLMLEHGANYATPSGHPERPERVLSIWNRLAKENDIAHKCYKIPPRKASAEDLQRVHSAAMIEKLITLDTERTRRIDGDTYVTPLTPEAALLSAGLVIDTTLRVLSGKSRNGFAIVRPPGHHATPNTAMGFCFFSNVAVAARRALLEPNCKKVLIVDWDVHHGNGTQDAFYDDDSVLFFSIHRYGHGFYPGSGYIDEVGVGKGAGYTINVPLPVTKVGDDMYLNVWDKILLPIAKEFNPDLVIVSAGFDSAKGDPLGGMCVSPTGYQELLQPLLGLAGGKCVLALEGGYSLSVIADCAEACMITLTNPPTKPVAEPDPALLNFTDLNTRQTVNYIIEAVREKLVPHWKILDANGTTA